MPRTKPLYIYASSDKYNNLFEELVAIHEQIQKGSTDGITERLAELVKEVDELKASTSDIDNAVLNELKSAKGGFSSIDERFLALGQYDVINQMHKVSTTRNYEYKDGLVTKEIVRGDINYDIIYDYDSHENVIRETKYDLHGNVEGDKRYIYDDNENIVTVISSNADDIMTFTNALVDKEQNERLDKIESIDFVELGKVLDGWNLIQVAQTVQELVTQVQHLMLHLPENQGYLINTSELIRRIDDIEMRLDANQVYHSFDVVSTQSTYAIPDDIVGKNFGVYMEGLLLEKDIDYIIEGSSITFKIPLIDEFTITCRD